METGTKDLFQVLALVVASVGGVIAAFRAIIEMRLNRRQRDEELRFRRTREAKLILDEFAKDRLSHDFMQMLDWSGRTYTTTDAKEVVITWDDLYKALRTSDLSFNEKEAYIRDCADAFFDYLEHIEHFIESGLLIFVDVGKPIAYYVKEMNRSHDDFERFIVEYDYDRALKFLNRFDEWTNCVAVKNIQLL
jgi:hypothetical protein